MAATTSLLELVAHNVGLLAIIGVLLLVVFPISYAIYQRFFSPLAKVPGPFWASITPLWRVSRVLKGNWHLENIALHEKYGESLP
jgi:hypothetical protein